MKYIAKTEGRRGLILFFPEVDARPGFIQYWTPAEGHGEACHDYYRALRNPRPERAAELARIVSLYERMPPEPITLERVYRDSEKTYQARHAWAMTAA
jgi:hypothetical protein